MDITLERILSLLPHKPDGKFVHGAKSDFAKKIGLKSGNVVSDWICGRSNSYNGYIYQIAAKYGVSVEWLKGEIDEKSPAPAENSKDGTVAELMRLYESATPEQREEMLSIAKIILARRK